MFQSMCLFPRPRFKNESLIQVQSWVQSWFRFVHESLLGNSRFCCSLGRDNHPNSITKSAISLSMLLRGASVNVVFNALKWPERSSTNAPWGPPLLWTRRTCWQFQNTPLCLWSEPRVFTASEPELQVHIRVVSVRVTGRSRFCSWGGLQTLKDSLQN